MISGVDRFTRRGGTCRLHAIFMNQLCIIWGYQEELSSTAGHGEKNSPLAYVVRGLAAELVQHRVAVIMVDTLAAVRAAAAVTTTVPIVFAMGADPVKAGLVESLNPPEASKSRRWIVPSEFNCQNSPRRRLRRFAG